MEAPPIDGGHVESEDGWDPRDKKAYIPTD